VLERFRDTVEPLRRKHGIQTVGYWFASGTTNGTFAYLMAAASKEELQKLEREFSAETFIPPERRSADAEISESPRPR
jgi:hypothetical protein